MIAKIVATSEEFYASRGEEFCEITLENLEKMFDEDCKKISEQCVSEGYPSHGSNYDLRCESRWNTIMQTYPWLFMDDEDEYEEEE